MPVPDEVRTAPTEAPQHVQLSTGATLAVSQAGQGGAALLLVHGYPLDRTMWRAQLDGIAGHRLIAPDLRGFGASAHVAGGGTLGTHADDLAALLDALQVDRVVFAGLSMGGYIAFEFLRRHRDRVHALVLLDTKAEADDAKGRAGRDAAMAKARDEGAGAIAMTMAEKLFAAGTPPEERAELIRRMSATSVETITDALAAMRDRPDSTALLPTLGDIPTLILVGAEDQLTPPDAAQRMAEAIPGAELVVVAGAGHVPPVERPAVVNETLQRFLDRVV